MSSSVDAKPVRKKTAHKIVKNATLKRTKRDSAYKQTYFDFLMALCRPDHEKYGDIKIYKELLVLIHNKKIKDRNNH